MLYFVWGGAPHSPRGIYRVQGTIHVSRDFHTGKDRVSSPAASYEKLFLQQFQENGGLGPGDPRGRRVVTRVHRPK